MTVDFKTIALLACGCFFWGSAFGQDMKLTTKTKQNYLGGNGAIFYSHPVQATDLRAQWRNGVFSDFSVSTSFNGEKNLGKELDVTLGKLGKVGRLNYQGDLNYYVVQGKDVVNVNAEVSHDIQLTYPVKVSPFVRTEWYFPTQVGGPRAGVMAIIGARGFAKVATRVAVSVDLTLKKDSGNFAFDSALLSHSYCGLPINVTDNLTLTPGVSLSRPISAVRDGRVGKAALEIGVSYVLH